MNFTLHTEPSVSPPEFSIIIQTQGGPATDVIWWGQDVKLHEDSNHETSQIIVNTLHISVYENRLRVRDRKAGIYHCIVTRNSISDDEPTISDDITLTVMGLFHHIHALCLFNAHLFLCSRWRAH